jgi:hypothetical protein
MDPRPKGATPWMWARLPHVVLAGSFALTMTWSLGGAAASADPAARVGPSPDLIVAATSDAHAPLPRGKTFSYAIVATNVGAVEAHDVHIHDEIPDGLHVLGLPVVRSATCSVASSVGSDGREAWSVDCVRDRLGPGSSMTLPIDVEVQQEARCGVITNTAEVSGSDEPARLDDRKNYEENSDEIVCRSSLALEEAGPALVHVGDTITFFFDVTNDGETHLDDVRVDDGRCDAPPRRADNGNGAPGLAPGESWRYRCAKSVAAGSGDPIRTIATATATDPRGRSISAGDRANVDVIRPRVQLEQRVSPTSGEPGDVVTFTYRVRNVGDTALFHLRVSDDVLGAIGTIERLGSGRTATLSAELVLPGSDAQVVGAATVRGRDAIGGLVSTQDRASVTVTVGAQPGVGEGSSSGTPFTGADATAPGVAALLLATLGCVSLIGAKRRRDLTAP